eukprot:6481851-Amphidinium_carterae.1
METQLLSEGQRAPFAQTLATALYCKNGITVIGSHTPYQAVFGRQVHLLPNLENERITDDDRLPKGMHNCQRLREIAVQAIVAETAKQRVARADRHRTRPALQGHDYQPGTKIDFWTPATQKE